MRYKRNEVIGRPYCDKEPIIHTNDKLIEKRELLKIELKKMAIGH
ncbi:hypothetical protein ABLO26_21020 [Neobacillus sp. 179-J 1A1 HS]